MWKIIDRWHCERRVIVGDDERLEKYMEVEGRTSIGEAVRNILHDYLKDWEKEQIELMKE